MKPSLKKKKLKDFFNNLFPIHLAGTNKIKGIVPNSIKPDFDSLLNVLRICYLSFMKPENEADRFVGPIETYSKYSHADYLTWKFESMAEIISRRVYMQWLLRRDAYTNK